MPEKSSFDREILSISSFHLGSHVIDPAQLAALAVAVFGLLSVGFSVYLVQRCSKKILMLVSSVGTSLAFMALGAFYLLATGKIYFFKSK